MAGRLGCSRPARLRLFSRTERPSVLRVCWRGARQSDSSCGRTCTSPKSNSIRFTAAYRARRASPRYQSLPRFPAVERDFSLLLPDGVTFAQIAQAIQSLGIAEVTGVEALDLFRGKGVPDGEHSLLIRVTFQSYTATLTDAQLTEASGRIVGALAALGARLRTT